MKITFKDLKQNKFVIEAEPSETIGDVKAKIRAEKGWESEELKLIYSGKILQDAGTVESYKIEEKGFIVCMTKKPKPAAASSSKPAPSTPAPTSAQSPAAPAAPAQSTTAAQAAPSTPSPAPQATSESSRFNDPSALTMGSEREAAIANMESMGFPRADIDRAMRAAFFNPDRAVEYLLNGIPESALREQQQPQQGQGATSPPSAAGGNTGATAAAGTTESDEPINLFQAAAQAGQNRGAAGAGEEGGAASAAGRESLAALAANPQFQQLRRIVQQQPQMLQPILQQVGAGNPQLARLINENQEEFLRLLIEDGDEDVALPPGAQVVSVTEEENAAIQRLCNLGFSRDAAVQAYFACDKNEELAANFLFDQPDDFDDQ